jgi:hypothetical protein
MEKDESGRGVKLGDGFRRPPERGEVPPEIEALPDVKPVDIREIEFSMRQGLGWLIPPARQPPVPHVAPRLRQAHQDPPRDWPRRPQ